MRSKADAMGSTETLTGLAASHGGYLTSREAVAAGVSHRMLSHHVSRGVLERVGRGLYRLTWLPQHRFGDVIAALRRSTWVTV